MKILLLIIVTLSVVGLALAQHSGTTQEDHQHFLDQLTYNEAMEDTDDDKKIVKSEDEWKKLLSSGEYRILRKRGTEMPYVNEYDGFYEEGVYVCRACGNPMFHSDTKFNSRTGWPSFYQPIREGAVGEVEDNSFFMKRIETVCARCDSHIGHVFDDGPEPTGLRYCMNSQAMKFIPKEKSESSGSD